MLALVEVESDRCRCGGWLSETTDPEGDHRYETKKRYCFRCRAHEQFMTAQAAIDATLKGTGEDQTWGRMAYTVPIVDVGDDGHVIDGTED